MHLASDYHPDKSLELLISFEVSSVKMGASCTSSSSVLFGEPRMSIQASIELVHAHDTTLSKVVPACNLSTGELEEGRLKFKASLKHIASLRPDRTLGDPVWAK